MTLGVCFTSVRLIRGSPERSLDEILRASATISVGIDRSNTSAFGRRSLGRWCREIRDAPDHARERGNVPDFISLRPGFARDVRGKYFDHGRKGVAAKRIHVL